MKGTIGFSRVAIALSLLILGAAGCSEVNFTPGVATTLAKDTQLSVPPSQNTCQGIPELAPWTVVDGVIRQPTPCADGSQTEDIYELVKVYVCDDGRVTETGQHTGRLIQAGQCVRPPNRCGEFEEGQVRDNFSFVTEQVPCPEDSQKMITLTFLLRSAETCLEGGWASNGPAERSLYQIDDSQCRIKPPQGQNCGPRKHNETWQETETESKEAACGENETGRVLWGRNIHHQFICLNGTVSRTLYQVGEWSQTENQCHKSCVKEGLIHGGSKVNVTSEQRTEDCESGFSGTITSERSVTETLLCQDGQVSSTVSQGHWNVIANSCKQDCRDGRRHGDQWESKKEESKTDACPAGHVGQIDYRREVTNRFQCDDGKVISELIEGGWQQLRNTCRQQCKDGHLDGDTWQTSREETRTTDCGAGYRGTVVQRRTLTNIFLCTEGVIKENVQEGAWQDVQRSCIQLCPSGYSEGETWERHREDDKFLNCPKNFIGFIKRTYSYKEAFVCKGGVDTLVRTTIMSSKDEDHCEPFTVSGRCGGDTIYRSEVDGRRAWVLKCKDHPAISFFFKLGGEKLYTHGGHYPAFGQVKNGKVKGSWQAPVDPSEPCNIPEDVRIIGLCTAGCFTGDQRVLFAEQGYVGIKEAFEADLPEVMVVRPGSFFEDIRLVAERIGNYVVDLAPAKQRIIEFKTAGGGRLQVTEGHPMLTPDGRLVEAVKLRRGDQLVTYNGQTDEIVEARNFEIFDRVYNLYPETKDLLKNLIVAEGFITGSAYYQSEGNEHMGRVILRHSLVHDLFSRKRR